MKTPAKKKIKKEKKGHKKGEECHTKNVFIVRRRNEPEKEEKSEAPATKIARAFLSRRRGLKKKREKDQIILNLRFLHEGKREEGRNQSKSGLGGKLKIEDAHGNSEPSFRLKSCHRAKWVGDSGVKRDIKRGATGKYYNTTPIAPMREGSPRHTSRSRERKTRDSEGSLRCQTKKKVSHTAQ